MVYGRRRYQPCGGDRRKVGPVTRQEEQFERVLYQALGGAFEKELDTKEMGHCSFGIVIALTQAVRVEASYTRFTQGLNAFS
jgi:hypothetical protein